MGYHSLNSNRRPRIWDMITLNFLIFLKVAPNADLKFLKNYFGSLNVTSF
jgi:hypothetical protein